MSRTVGIDELVPEQIFVVVVVGALLWVTFQRAIDREVLYSTAREITITTTIITTTRYSSTGSNIQSQRLMATEQLYGDPLLAWKPLVIVSVRRRKASGSPSLFVSGTPSRVHPVPPPLLKEKAYDSPHIYIYLRLFPSPEPERAPACHLDCVVIVPDMKEIVGVIVRFAADNNRVSFTPLDRDSGVFRSVCLWRNEKQTGDEVRDASPVEGFLC